MSDEFVSVKGSGNTWNPKKDADGGLRETATAEDYLDGIYVDKRDGVGQYSSSVITIEKDGGERVDVWCDTVLLDLIEKVPYGKKIRIQWLGKKKKKGSMTKTAKELRDTDFFNDWDVMISKDSSTAQTKPGTTAKKETSSSSATSNKVTESKFEEETEDDLPF